jgi:hypothetical protein
MRYEIRMEGGKVFHIGYLTGLLGELSVVQAPEFCSGPGFLSSVREGGHGVWNVRPIDDQARRHTFVDDRSLCRRIEMTDRTPGVGLISLAGGKTHVDVYLSTTEFSGAGVSIYEDWIDILKANKDDLAKEVLLRMEFGAVTPVEIEGFRDHKCLATKDIELQVRPRPIQWARDD